MSEIIGNVAATPEELLAEFIFAEECGKEPSIEEFVSRLQAESERTRFRTLAATMRDSQPLFPLALRAQVVLAGRYRLIQEIGTGGFGKVWRAADERLDARPVAVKILNVLAANRDVHLDLARERRALARMEHPSIVPVLDVGEHEGNPFLVMQLVEGVTLAKLIAAVAKARPAGAAPPIGAIVPLLADATSLPPDWWTFAARTVVAVLHGVQAAHDVGVVHRDIKPGNVMIRRSGEIVLLDFGIARLVDPSAYGSVSGLTGTLAYMAPEQVKRDEGEFPVRVDVYQVGRLLYELLTLQPAMPPRLSFGEMLERARVGDFEPPARRMPSVPRVLATICMHALEPEPGRRYQAARDFAQDLEAFLAQMPPRHVSLSRAATCWYGARRVLRRHPRTAWSVGGLAAGLVAAGMLTAGGPGVDFVGGPQRQGRRFVLHLEMSAPGGLFAMLEILSPMLVVEHYVPLDVLSQEPVDGRPGVWQVVLQLPAGIDLPPDLPEERLEVRCRRLDGDAATQVRDFFARQTAWILDPANDGRRGVPADLVRSWAEAAARGAGSAGVDLTGSGWARARVGGT